MSSSTRVFLFTVVALFISAIALLSVAIASADVGPFDQPVEMSGYAWSSNVGWISLNCSNDSSCATSDYKVRINTDYTVTGYAWSSNVGWIKFGGLSGMPASGGQAQINNDRDQMTGWIRACSATDAGDCTGGLDPDGGGWDGWISLNCSNNSGCATSNYATTVGVGSFGNYAWGGDVIGWVSFATADFTQPCTPALACNAENNGYAINNQWCESEAPVSCAGNEYCYDTVGCKLVDINYQFSVNQLLVKKEGKVTLDWSVDGADVSQCKVTGNNNDSWIGLTDESVSGGVAIVSSPLTRQVTAFTLSCVPAGGGSFYDLKTIEVNLVPTIIES